MNRITGFLIRLYPWRWRQRYQEEFRELLSDVGPDPRAYIDLLKGAVAMHFSARSFPAMALVLSTAGLFAGLGISYLTPELYVSTAVLMLNDDVGSARKQMLSRTSLTSIVRDPALQLYSAEQRRQPLEDVIETMRTRDLHVSIPPATAKRRAALSISFICPDRFKAKRAVQLLVTRLIQTTLEDRVRQPKAGAASPYPVEVIDPPSLPDLPIYPNRNAAMLTGFAAGFALSCAMAAFRKSPPPFTPLPSGL